MKFIRYLGNTFSTTSMGLYLFGCIILFISKVEGQTLIAFVAIIFFVFALIKSKGKRIDFIFCLILILISFFIINKFTTLQEATASEGGIVTGYVNDVKANHITLIFANYSNKPLASKVNIVFDKNDFKVSDIKTLDYFEVNVSNLEKYRKDELVARLSLNSEYIIKPNLLGGIVKSLSDRINFISSKYFGENSGIIKAMVFGLKDDLNSSDSKMFRELGIGHILVASGANIMMILGALALFFDRVTFKYRRILELFIVISYVALVGFQGSMVRAFFFFCINYLSVLLGREIDYLQKLLVTIVLTIFLFPQLVFGISFLLSFLASLSIKFSEDLVNLFKIHNKIVINLTRNIIIVMTVNVLTAYSFHSFNLTGIISNTLVLFAVEILVSYGFAFMVLAAVFELLNLDLIIQLLAYPLILLTEAFNYVVLKLDSIFGSSMNFSVGIKYNDAMLIFIILAFSWAVVLFLSYKRNTEVFDESI